MFEEGQIVWLNFPYSEILDEKNRPAFVWEDEGEYLIVSMITSRIRGGPWEVSVNPDIHNNLSRPSVIRIDNTILIPKTKLTSEFPGESGFANPFAIAMAKEKMRQWLNLKSGQADGVVLKDQL
jgi:mRNA-degrading endonuclease toxin of MazEF toxin-antitoxin module